MNGSKTAYIPIEDRNYQKYYQWVPFIFIFQAVLSYIPAMMWKIWEGGRLRALCSKISEFSI